MVTLCWAAKGGSGTTVVTSTLALESARPSLLVDLAGEVPSVLGHAEPDGPGVVDWLIGTGDTSQLLDLLVEIDDDIAVLPFRLSGSIGTVLPETDPQRWDLLVSWFDHWEAHHDGDVWIDAGTGTPPEALARAVDRRWLVTRACYLSLRRAAAASVRPTGVVFVAEPGRSLRQRDVERSLGVPVVTTVSLDPKVARAVDAGLLLSRPPPTIRRELRKVAA